MFTLSDCKQFKMESGTRARGASSGRWEYRAPSSTWVSDKQSIPFSYRKSQTLHRICLYQKFFIIYQIFNSSLVFIWQPNRVSTTRVSIRNQLNSAWILKTSSDSWRILGALTLEGFAVSGGPFAQTSHTKARVRVVGQSQPLGANLAERLGNQPQCCSLWGKSKFSVEQKMVAQEQL